MQKLAAEVMVSAGINLERVLLWHAGTVVFQGAGHCVHVRMSCRRFSSLRKKGYSKMTKIRYFRIRKPPAHSKITNVNEPSKYMQRIIWQFMGQKKLTMEITIANLTK